MRMPGHLSEPRSLRLHSFSCEQPANWSPQRLADVAIDALIDEARLTPKPALVDRRGTGAHSDLDLTKLLCSARALRETFLRMALYSMGRLPDCSLRAQLALLGREGEADMFAATGGSNAHRGAIWALGLLVAASAIGGSDMRPPELATLAGRIAALPDRNAPSRDSNGIRAGRRYGVTGAKGEAVAGFPHVIAIGLPALWMARANGGTETCARLDALIAIMASLDDTCLLHRGGLPALVAAKLGARTVLALGGSSTAEGWRALLALDFKLRRLNASPGGCADLLAACLYIDRLYR
jgi:triphosphoribosyl-dephospho-CoA synthase